MTPTMKDIADGMTTDVALPPQELQRTPPGSFSGKSAYMRGYEAGERHRMQYPVSDTHRWAVTKNIRDDFDAGWRDSLLALPNRYR